MVKVDGKIVDYNVPVTDNNYIQIGAKTGIYTPTKQDTRIWLYHKPQKLMCSHSDPENRPTIFQALNGLGLTIPHVIAVGRLDFLSEGLMVITNDGDLARALELPSNNIERSYKVRVFGRMFNENVLQKLHEGVKIKGRKYGPYIAEIIKRQSTNTWLHMKLYEGKNNEIRKVMRKFSLRVNRLIRTSYGPYNLGLVPNPNDLAEVKITRDLKKLMYKYYKEKTMEAQSRLNQQKGERMYIENQKQALKEVEEGKDKPEGRLIEEEPGKNIYILKTIILITILEEYFNVSDFEQDVTQPKGLGDKFMGDKFKQ